MNKRMLLIVLFAIGGAILVFLLVGPSEETRDEATERCRKKSAAKSVQYVSVIRTNSGWRCAYGAGAEAEQ